MSQDTLLTRNTLMYAIIHQGVILHNSFFAAKFTVYVFPISEEKLCFICHNIWPLFYHGFIEWLISENEDFKTFITRLYLKALSIIVEKYKVSRFYAFTIGTTCTINHKKACIPSHILRNRDP